MKIPLKSEPLRLISDILQSAVYWCCPSYLLQLSCLVQEFNSISQNRQNIFFIVLRHVGAKSALLRRFLCNGHKKASFARFLAPPFQNRSRSLRLFACKRALDASRSLPTCFGYGSSIPAGGIFQISFSMKFAFW